MAWRTGSVNFPTEADDSSALFRVEVRDVSIRNDVGPEREAIRRKKRDVSDDALNVETAFAVARRVLLRLEEKGADGAFVEVPKTRWEALLNEYEKLAEAIMEKALALRDEKNGAIRASLPD